MDNESARRGLAGQWAVVTGGSKGIGQSIAMRLLEGGASVVLVARNQPDLDRTVALAQPRLQGDQRVVAMCADVSEARSIAELFTRLRDEIPHLDHFVANAGTGRVIPLLELGDEELDAIVALNFTGAIRCVREAARMIGERPVSNSCIVVVSSIRGLSAIPGRLAYAATKAGLNQAVKTAAAELAPQGIRVNILSPGITETPLALRNAEAFAEAVANVPMGRAATPGEVAEAAYFLCTPAARFITGLNMIVDGGESLG